MRAEHSVQRSLQHTACCPGRCLVPGSHAAQQLRPSAILATAGPGRSEHQPIPAATAGLHWQHPAQPGLTSLNSPAPLCQTYFSRLSNKAKIASQTQEKCAPLKWLKVYQNSSPDVRLQAMTNARAVIWPPLQRTRAFSPRLSLFKLIRLKNIKIPTVYSDGSRNFLCSYMTKTHSCIKGHFAVHLQWCNVKICYHKRN